MKKKLLLMLFVVAAIFTTQANAAVCSSAASTYISQAQNQRISEDAQKLSAVSDNFLNNIQSSLSTVGCTDAWPSGNIGLSLPSFDSLIKKAKDAAISKACSLAREKVSEAMGNISQSVSLDIPYLGNVASASVSTGTSSSAGVTGVDSVWDSISNAIK